MPEYVHHDPVGPSPYEDSSSGSNSSNNNSSNSNNRGNDYLARLGGREPLQESTGNIQHHNHHHHHPHYPYGQRALPSLSAASSASCTPVLSHTLSAIPAPPILPTQALGSTGVVVPSSSSSASQQQQDQHQNHHGQQQQQHSQGGVVLGAGPAAALAAAGGTSTLRLRRHQLNLNKQSRHSKNPIYLSPEFCQYRMKQKDKDEQKWPDILEDAFLDGTFFPLFLLPSPIFPSIPDQVAFPQPQVTYIQYPSLKPMSK